MDKGLLSIISAGCGQLVKMLITLDHMVYLDRVLHANACQHYLTTGMCNILFLDGQGFAEYHFSWLLSITENAHNS